MYVCVMKISKKEMLENSSNPPLIKELKLGYLDNKKIYFKLNLLLKLWRNRHEQN